MFDALRYVFVELVDRLGCARTVKGTRAVGLGGLLEVGRYFDGLVVSGLVLGDGWDSGCVVAGAVVALVSVIVLERAAVGRARLAAVVAEGDELRAYFGHWSLRQCLDRLHRRQVQ